MSKFNAGNKGHKKGYPLFLGEELGVHDTINQAYPEFEELYQLQSSYIWNEFEVDITQDRMDMLNAPAGKVDLMVKNLMWQTVADSVASRSILETFGRYVSNPQVNELFSIQTHFETIHSRTYSHIIRQTFTQDPQEIIDGIYSDKDLIQRSGVIVRAFDNLAVAHEFERREQMRRIVLALVSLFGLEAISFVASFSVTFGIAEGGIFQGIGALLQLICRDELVHSRFDHAILKALMRDHEWFDVILDCKHDIKEVLDQIVENEINWARYVFSGGRSCTGLSSQLMEKYVMYCADPVYKSLGIGIELESTIPKNNPLPYMEKYLDPSKIQGANMEIQSGSYAVGTLEDDTSELDLSRYL